MRVSTESKRGCGFRASGGTYVMGGESMAPCGRLPLPIDRCPTCGHGLKQKRGFQWFNPREFWQPEGCGSRSDPASVTRCSFCLAGRALPERAGLIWIGVAHYPTPADFTDEAIKRGISRRLDALPREFTLSKDEATLGQIIDAPPIYLAHPRAIVATCEACEGTGVMCAGTCEAGLVYRPGVFSAFVPHHVEKVFDPGTPDDDPEVEKARARGIEPVIVERAEG